MRSGLPRISPAYLRFFRAYTRRFLRRHFHAVRLSRGGAPPRAGERPLIIYLNHSAWWDPLACLFLAEKYFPVQLACAPIDARQFQRYRIMGKIGLFPVEPGVSGARTLLRTSQQILAQPNSMLWLTPQARFRDTRERPLQFAGGLAHLARHAPRAQFVPLALEYVHWQERLPEVLLRFGPPRNADELCALSTGDITMQLETDLADAMNALAEQSMARDPDGFKTLLDGSEAVSPVYDAARRIRARLRGQPFRAAHSFAPP